MSSRLVIGVLLLVALVLSGPVAMAFEGCVSMGALCDGPCNASSCVLSAAALSMVPSPVSPVYTVDTRHHLRNTFAGHERPPKPSPRSRSSR